MDDLKDVGESSYNPGDGTDQRVQSLVFMMMMIKITQIIEKISIKSLFILLKKAQTMVQKTSRKNVTSTVLIFSSFLSFLWTSWVEKSQST